MSVRRTWWCWSTSCTHQLGETSTAVFTGLLHREGESVFFAWPRAPSPHPHHYPHCPARPCHCWRSPPVAGVAPAGPAVTVRATHTILARSLTSSSNSRHTLTSTGSSSNSAHAQLLGTPCNTTEPTGCAAATAARASSRRSYTSDSRGAGVLPSPSGFRT